MGPRLGPLSSRRSYHAALATIARAHRRIACLVLDDTDANINGPETADRVGQRGPIARKCVDELVLPFHQSPLDGGYSVGIDLNP